MSVWPRKIKERYKKSGKNKSWAKGNLFGFLHKKQRACEKKGQKEGWKKTWRVHKSPKLLAVRVASLRARSISFSELLPVLLLIGFTMIVSPFLSRRSFVHVVKISSRCRALMLPLEIEMSEFFTFRMSRPPLNSNRMECSSFSISLRHSSFTC